MKKKPGTAYVQIKIMVVSMLCLAAFTTSAQFTPEGGSSPTSSALPLTINTVYVGLAANGSNTTTAVGAGALSLTPTSTPVASPVGSGYNTAIGIAALKYNSTGNQNVAVGNSTMLGSATAGNAGVQNVAVGNEAMYNGYGAANRNVGIGFRAMYANSTGNDNISVGAPSLNANVAGSRNTALGGYALQLLANVDSSSENTGVGYSALGGLTKGNFNAVLGKNAGMPMSNGHYNVAIGAGATLNNGNYQFNLQNAVYGINMGNGSSGGVYAGNVAIGMQPGQYPLKPGLAKLEVGGTLKIDVVNNATNSTNEYLFVDANGFVNKTTLPTATLTTNCSTAYFLTMNGTSANTLTCSEISDNGGTVQIGTTLAGNKVFGTPTIPYNQYGAGSGAAPMGATDSYKLYVQGWTGATGFVALSDKRLKTDIRKIEGSLSKIVQLNGYTYDWNKNVKADFGLNDLRQAGFLAQEVVEIMPEAVVVNSNGVLGLNYNAIMPLLAEGIKEQQIEIKQLQAQNQTLQLELSEIKNKINQLVPGNIIVKADAFEVNPNPVNGSSTISYKIDNGSSKAAFAIYDLQGKMVKQFSLSKNVTEGKITLNKTDLQNGLYIICLMVNDKEIQSKKILVAD